MISFLPTTSLDCICPIFPSQKFECYDQPKFLVEGRKKITRMLWLSPKKVMNDDATFDFEELGFKCHFIVYWCVIESCKILLQFDRPTHLPFLVTSYSTLNVTYMWKTGAGPLLILWWKVSITAWVNKLIWYSHTKKSLIILDKTNLKLP